MFLKPVAPGPKGLKGVSFWPNKSQRGAPGRTTNMLFVGDAHGSYEKEQVIHRKYLDPQVKLKKSPSFGFVS